MKKKPREGSINRSKRDRRREGTHLGSQVVYCQSQSVGDSAYGLATISYATGDARAGTVMLLMVSLGLGLRFVQETRADAAAAKLKAMISVTATVVRNGEAREIPISELVPGDIVQLSAGDMIPGDVRLFSAKDLFIIQATLTGESLLSKRSSCRHAPRRRLAGAT